jgi:hypothetical protein
MCTSANAIDPDLALGVVKTLDELREVSRSPASGAASELARLGGLALVLSGVGHRGSSSNATRRRGYRL